MVNVITQLFKYMVIDHGDLYDSLFFTVFIVKKKRKTQNIQESEFSDAVDPFYALYNYFSE